MTAGVAGEVTDALRAQGVAPELAARLGAYGGYVLEANATMNLTAAREPAAFAEHILDALTLAADVDGPLIDIGSGAGLPGIPLAIATGVPVTLIDSIGKKARFLASALRELGLAGEALDARAEDLAHDAGYRERFRTATARAVASAPAVLELTVPFLAIGGRLLMQRGAFPDAERHAVADAAPMLGGRLAEERVLSGERRLVVVEKAGPCPGRFPRRAGVPAKRPLCFPANALASR